MLLKAFLIICTTSATFGEMLRSNDVRFEDCEKFHIKILTGAPFEADDVKLPPEADAKYSYFYAKLRVGDDYQGSDPMFHWFMPTRARNFCRYCVDGFVVTDEHVTDLFLPTYMGLYREPNATHWTWANNGSSVTNLTQYRRFSNLAANDPEYYDNKTYDYMIAAYAYQTDTGYTWSDTMESGMWPSPNYVVCQSPVRSNKHEWKAFVDDKCRRLDNETCGKFYTKLERTCHNNACQPVRQSMNYGHTFTHKCDPEECGMKRPTNGCRRKIGNELFYLLLVSEFVRVMF